MLESPSTISEFMPESCACVPLEILRIFVPIEFTGKIANENTTSNINVICQLIDSITAIAAIITITPDTAANKDCTEVRNKSLSEENRAASAAGASPCRRNRSAWIRLEYIAFFSFASKRNNAVLLATSWKYTLKPLVTAISKIPIGPQ